MADQEPAVAEPGLGATRRGMLRGAAGLGAAGLTAAVLSILPADAAQVAGGTTGDRAARHDEPLVAHVHDARTGVIDLYTGTRHIRFTDRQLAARLARAGR